MSLQTRQRRQKCVYWAANGFDNNGEAKVDAAIQLKVRWEDDNGEILDAENNTIQTVATVVVDRDIPLGSIMWLGALSALPADPTNYSDLRQVVAFNKTPNIKNVARNTRRTVRLVKYSDAIPATA